MQTAAPAASASKGSWGAVIGIIIVVLILAVGGAYYYLQYTQQQAAVEQGEQQATQTPSAEDQLQNELNASAQGSAQSDVDNLGNSL